MAKAADDKADKSQVQPPKDTSTTGRADGDPNKKADSDLPETEPVRGTEPPREAPTLGTPDELRKYENMSLNELRKEAESQGVEINLDVEKAFYVSELRRKWAEPDDDDARPNENQPQGEIPLFDLMSLADLRKAAAEKDIKLPKDFERGHLETELRANRTGAPPTAAPGKGAQHVR